MVEGLNLSVPLFERLVKFMLAKRKLHASFHISIRALRFSLCHILLCKSLAGVSKSRFHQGLVEARVLSESEALLFAAPLFYAGVIARRTQVICPHLPLAACTLHTRLVYRPRPLASSTGPSCELSRDTARLAGQPRLSGIYMCVIMYHVYGHVWHCCA